jgi:LysR family transcriptional regulator, transcriptional activator for leuABCD operon
MNLRGIDLNLLTVFEVLYEERNQQRAAERLGMTQPAVSSAMSRLRDVMREDLFLPGPRGVTVTIAGDRLFSQIRPALETIREGIRGVSEFDPAKATRTFRMCAADAALGGVGELLAWIAKDAPGVRLVIEAMDEPAELKRRLRIGEVDFVADYARYDDEELIHDVVFQHELVAIARKGHPRINGHITKKQFVEERHVTHIEKHAPGKAPRVRDSVAGLSYRSDVELGNPMAIPIIVFQTDLIAVTIRGVAEFFAKPFGIQVLELPFKIPPVPVYLIWHRSRDRDSGHAWLRNGMKKIIAKANA